MLFRSLWWKGDALVVIGDNDLKKGVLHFYHDTPVAGHPGILNTFSLLKCNYWWPNMKQFVINYIKGCAQCQANKVNTHKTRPPLYPIKPQNTLPFETIALDFITKLPESRGFDTICYDFSSPCPTPVAINRSAVRPHSLFHPTSVTVLASRSPCLPLRYLACYLFRSASLSGM